MSPMIRIGNHKFAKGGRDWLTLTLSLLLAIFIWTVHNLSLDYSTYLQYRVVVDSNIEGRGHESVSEDLLIMRVKASGYYILKQRYGRGATIVISLDSKFLHQQEDKPGEYKVYTNEIKEMIVSSIESNVEIEFMTVESMTFKFPEINSKKVPVVAKLDIDYSGQYMPVGNLYLSPDSVVISGEEKYISGVESVSTKLIHKNRVKSSFQGMVKIASLKGVYISDKEVYFNQNVERYVERSITVPLVPINVPENGELILIPSKIKLTYRQPFGYRIEDEENAFIYGVDYQTYVKTINSKVVPVPLVTPENIFSISFTPSFVEAAYIDR